MERKHSWLTRTAAAATVTSGVRRLVIVESPTKARKIAGYLGSNYIVESSRGHIRDLPRAAADVPAKYKSEPWARLGVNVDADFEPLYIVSPDKKSTVTELKGLLKDVDELYLATDGDREGEAIAWHLLETLKPRIPVKRMVFHEITEPAIRAAAEDPRDLDNDLVDAQETRRILDRLYGYEVSPGAVEEGRAEAVGGPGAVGGHPHHRAARTRADGVPQRRLLGRRRRAGRQRVRSAQRTPPTFTARARSTSTAGGWPPAATSTRWAQSEEARRGAGARRGQRRRAGRRVCAARSSTVASVEQKPYTRRPYPPFMTSTLQQEAGRKLRFSSERTMSIAQRLYENGYITYMRTDSTTLSESAINAARNQARQLYGEEYVHPTPRQYTRKVKNAQEAHEAIRPAGDVVRRPRAQLHARARQRRVPALRADLAAHGRLADGRRARHDAVAAHRRRTASGGQQVVFTASGRTITFAGLPEGLRREPRRAGRRRGRRRREPAAAT